MAALISLSTYSELDIFKQVIFVEKAYSSKNERSRPCLVSILVIEVIFIPVRLIRSS